MASPPTPTAVTISATIQILGRTVTVNTGDINELRRGNFNFSLSDPVVLGSIDDFIQWLDDNLHTGVSVGDVDRLEQYIPIVPLRNAFHSFLTAQITITTLVINTKTKTYAFGATMTFIDPISILGVLKFDGIGVLISHESQTGSP